MRDLVLTVDPALTLTKVGLFRGVRPVARHVEHHPERSDAHRLIEEVPLRTRAVRAFLDQSGVGRNALAAVVGRGGLLRPVESGTYLVDDAMLRDVERAQHGEDPANLGVPIAKAIAEDQGCPAFVVDPLSVDEIEVVARASGASWATPRTPRCDALVMRAAARHHAAAVQRPVEELRLVVAHVAGTCSLCAMHDGRLIEAALFSDAGTRDLDEVAQRAERGDAKSMMLLDGLSYRAARCVGELAVALGGEVDAVLIAGAGAQVTAVVNGICRRVEWIAPVFVYPGADDLLPLAEGAWRVLNGDEQAKRYG